VSEADTLPAIAGRFESRLTPKGNKAQEQTHEWYLWRQPHLLETQAIKGETGERWELSKSGQISYLQIFHKENRIIEYTTGDLRALQSHPDWLKLACVIDPTFLKTKLRLHGSVKALGRQTQRYTGRVEGMEFEVLWLEKEKIPALVRRTVAEYQETVQLKELYALGQSPWPRKPISGYVHIDYADLGDKESDPFVRSLRQGYQE
jgi:hypothetical protein